MKKYGTWIAIGGLVVFIVAAIFFVGGDSAETGPDAGTGIPVQDPNLVAAGGPLYQANCPSCTNRGITVTLRSSALSKKASHSTTGRSGTCSPSLVSATRTLRPSLPSSARTNASQDSSHTHRDPNCYSSSETAGSLVL